MPFQEDPGTDEKIVVDARNLTWLRHQKCGERLGFVRGINGSAVISLYCRKCKVNVDFYIGFELTFEETE